jgi:hypothetical protein
MPDLDLIKQEEQGAGRGAGGFPKVRSAPLAGGTAAETRAAISRD